MELSNKILKSRGPVRHRLLFIYQDLYNELKDYQVEIIDSKTYLNPFTPGDFIRFCTFVFKDMRAQDIKNLAITLNKNYASFNAYECSQRNLVNTYLASIKTGGTEVKVKHPTLLYSKIGVHSLMVGSDKNYLVSPDGFPLFAVHATKPLPAKLTINQVTAPPIKELAPAHSKDPKLILTNDSKILSVNPEPFKQVSKVSVEISTKAAKGGIKKLIGVDLQLEHDDYILFKETTIREIFEKHAGPLLRLNQDPRSSELSKEQ